MQVRSGPEAERLQQWQHDGFVILEGAISPSRVDAMFDDVDRLIWDASVPDPSIEVLNTAVPGEEPRVRSHSEVIALPAQSRHAMRNASWRLANFFHVSDAARDIATDAEISRAIDLLLGRPSKMRSTVTLLRGGETRLHQDAVLFACEPFNMTVTVGVACEDVEADAGPLLVYPGSHELPLWEGWTDYPRTMLKTCSEETAAAYHRWLESRVDRGREQRLMLRKGDAILWHGSLAHRASKPANPDRTLRLCVMHSFPDGCDKTDEIVSAHRRLHGSAGEGGH